jgi:hypothetical protein
MKTLQNIAGFESHAVLGTFKKNFHVTQEEASDIFGETKKWLYLCRLAYQNPSSDPAPTRMVITKELSIIDEMWHAFILNTREYHDFCTHFLGAFIHHVPILMDSTSTNNDRPSEANSDRAPQRLKEMRAQLLFTQKHLGHSTLTKWYGHYAKHYTTEKIKALSTK